MCRKQHQKDAGKRLLTVQITCHFVYSVMPQIDENQEIIRFRNFPCHFFVCAHKMVLSLHPERLKVNNKARERIMIMMTFGIMIVAVAAFALIAGEGMNLGIKSCK